MIPRELPLINFFNQKSPTKNFKFGETPSTSNNNKQSLRGLNCYNLFVSAIIFNQSRNFQVFVVIKTSLLTTNLHQTDIKSAAYAKLFWRTRWLEFKGSIVWSANRKRKQAELITNDAKVLFFQSLKIHAFVHQKLLIAGCFKACTTQPTERIRSRVIQWCIA